MDTQDIIKATQSTQRLIQDQDYYKYIFKKTERIVSVVFYITQNLPQGERNKSHIEDIELKAREVHNAILSSLEARAHVAEDSIREAAHAVITMESKLRVAQAMGLLSNEVLGVLVGEIDAVLRGMNKYLQNESVILSEPELSAKKSSAQKRSGQSQSSTRNVLPQTEVTAAQKDTRQARILTVIEARGEASIKDIVEVINDVSEKTIQRELSAMIEDNLVKRQGERRWSKYMLFNK